ncbi:MAG: SDR family oxidoreductase [Chloroflexi bacterium]|nr:MAG: SDR family oxidoreductase [Chloroflexota bacterium]
MAQERVAIVTGANRGIGLEVTRQLADLGYTVVLGSRDLGKGEAAARKLKVGDRIMARRLDVTEQSTIDRLRDEIATTFGSVHVLVNNAAIHYDTWENAADADLRTVQEALDTNLLGAWRMCQAFIPLLRKSKHGRIVNVSSEAGSLASMGAGAPAYAVSKVALNALTRMLAAELRRDRILINSVCPGWVATDMGGPGGRPVREGAASIVWAVELPDGGPTGGFFRDGHPVPW